MRRLTATIVAFTLAGCQGEKKTQGDPDAISDTGGLDTAELEPSYGECVTDDDCEQPEGCGEAYCDLHSLLCMVRGVDADGDGYPAMEVDGEVCEGGTDCDDASVAVHPGLLEVGCDMVDQNCDGVLDVLDDDGDGSHDRICGGDDCDDEDPALHPGADELCDTIDQDCDGEVLDGAGADDDTDGSLDIDCGGDDCDDTDPRVNPLEPELCDGVDNDCDGAVDGVIGLTAGIPVSSSDGTSMLTCSMAWSGSEYGIAWVDDRLGPNDIYFRRVTGTGVMASSEILVTQGGAQAGRHQTKWTGSTYGIAWTDTRLGPGDVYFALVGADGTVLASQQRITAELANSYSPGLEWTGSQFGVAWFDARDTTHGLEIWFARLAPDGTKLGTEVMVTTGASSFQAWIAPSIAWTGSTYGMAWMDDRSAQGIQFGLVDAVGGLITETRIETGGSMSGDDSVPLVWSGSEFGLIWIDQLSLADNYLFGRISAGGARVGSDLSLVSERPPLMTTLGYLAWTGSEYGALVQTMDYITMAPTFIMSHVSAEGALLGAPVEFPLASSGDLPIEEGMYFDAHWDASRFALVGPRPDPFTSIFQAMLFFYADCD